MALQPHKPCLTDKDPLMFDTNPSYLWQTAPAFCSSRILRQPLQPTFVCLHHIT